MTRVVGDPAWRLLDQDGYLVVTAGADEVWVIDDLPGALADELAACWSAEPPESNALSAQAQRALEHLRSLGAVGPQLALPARPGVGVVFVGEPVRAFIEALARLWPDEGDDLQVIVRTNAPLRRLAERAGEWADPHLLVDLASHHTLTLGPFVVPGLSACVGCAAGRVAARWGDPEPPPVPAATAAAAAETAAALVVTQLERIAAGHYDLADATVSLDLASLETTRSTCLRSASCPSCGSLVTDGRLELPWA